MRRLIKAKFIKTQIL